ncbi:phage baseplate assembly protein V, partial [Pseudomonas aeruginosa]
MFDAYLRLQLGPLIERLAALETEIEDLRRRAEGHNRIGTVAAVDP